MPMLLFSLLSTATRSRLRFAPAALVFLAALACAPRASAWAATEHPVVIALADLGMQAQGGRPAVPGSTVATAHFVGDHHVLVTFAVRRLMKRLPDTRPEDDDRMIDAVLVDVPSGKVAARTTWRVHDAGQYLWDLGHGRFLLRVRDRLAVIAPLANLSTEEPFQEHHLLGYERRVVGILVSAEGDLLTVETRDPNAIKEEDGAVVHKKVEEGVEINFYRLVGTGEGEGAQHAGVVRSKMPVEVPMTKDGYLDISQESRTRWLFDYYSHEGKKIELSPFDTSCFPRATFVSRSEFVAFGCHGSPDKIEIGGFDMTGQQMWQQNFYDYFARATFSFAPESGRFAIGRGITTSPPSLIGQDPGGDSMTGQDIQVMQTHSGKQLFHIATTPAQKSGQNFALSADGMELAVIRGGALEIYKMPGLSGKDKQEVKAAREFALETGNGPIRLQTRTQKTESAGLAPVTPPAPKSTAPVTAVASAVPAVAAATSANVPAAPQRPAENVIVNGDVPDDGPRKKPTLYGEGDAGTNETAPK
ncbi:hypothetical protein [Granulicella sibirica]|uniref:Uncharacterized protein n=1 Tax=Granulicella sibirica TaxID=2479048 RepID=A0A4Q0T6A4_9BACT|nr:hypothetical protein [Granulicella sibirica]RXH57529.1 hypothetical protein GRAN_0839 [Granulicella sibirica]